MTVQYVFNASRYRREWLRVERGLITVDEMAAMLTNPQASFAVDSRTVPLTAEQWRQVGLGNGMVCR